MENDITFAPYLTTNDMTTTIKTVAKLTPMTVEQIRMENRGYNPTIWDEKIDRFSSLKGIEFYKAEPQRGYDYTRYFAKYTLPEGLTIFKSVCYSSTLSNAGFSRVIITPENELVSMLIQFGDGEYGRAENTKSNRTKLAEFSKVLGYIWSNEF